MYTLGPDLLNLSPSAYTVAQELERYKAGVLKVKYRQPLTHTTEGWLFSTPRPLARGHDLRSVSSSWQADFVEMLGIL